MNIIAIYVDDMLLVCSKNMKNIILELNQSAEGVDRGPLSFYLEMEINRFGSQFTKINSPKKF